jgi:hypothetical protein
LLDARRADLEAFLGDLLQRRAPATAATRYKVLRILYAWLEEEEEIDASPMAQPPRPLLRDLRRPPRSPHHPPRPGRHDRARQRYDGLHAKADSTGFPEEAAACRAKAEQLRAKYGL